MYVDRVETKSNISDGPSRLDTAEIEAMGGVFTPPCLDLFSNDPPGDDPWEWFKSEN